MTRSALIMAGGRGERMAQSGSSVPKPLVTVGGVALLERNLAQLLRAGFDHVHVAVREDDADVRRYVAERLVPLGAARDATIVELVETVPLGNIGAAGRLHPAVADLLVVYADNLTAIDLGAIWGFHRGAAPDLTLATHREPFRMPYGEVEVTADGRVVGYTEKPVREVQVCSAVMVLGPRALITLPTDRPTGISDLARQLIADGADVRSWFHAAPWIDVNDRQAVERAERLVADHARVLDPDWTTA